MNPFKTDEFMYINRVFMLIKNIRRYLIILIYLNWRTSKDLTFFKQRGRIRKAKRVGAQ